MIEVKSTNKQSLIDFEDSLFMLVESVDKFDSGKALYVDAIVVNSSYPEDYNRIFKAVRTHYDPDVYLTPIFAVAYKNLPSLQERACDGITDLAKYEQLAKRVREIKANVAQLYLQQQYANSEEGYLYKLLQFLFTRDIPFTPVPDRFSRVNYYFPLLSDLLDDSDDHTAMEILETGLKKGYLTEGKMFDKVHLCDNCGSAHHNLRETCKSCGSVDLEIRDLVHHFKCAYVGPETDFVQEHSDDLMCPKCHKILRHIGNDYDKPSHIYVCNACDDPFQDPGFTYHCVDCGDTKDIHHLNEHRIKNMYLTTKGKYLVLNGLPKKIEKKSGLATDVLGIYDLAIFQNLLKQEQSRCRVTGGSSLLGEAHITDAGMNVLSRREIKILQGELSMTLKTYLNEFEMVTSVNPYTYYFLLINPDIERQEKIKDVIEYNLQNLIKSNVNKSEAVVEVDMRPLSEIGEDFEF